MSREIQLSSIGGLPVRADEGWGSNSMALGAPMPAQQQAPLKKIHRMMRGRYILAGVIGLVLGLVGAYFGWRSSQPQYASFGIIEIQPIIRNPMGNDRSIAMYSAYMQTQAKLLTGQRMIKGAMETRLWQNTGRGSFNDDDALGRFQQSLSAVRPRDTYYIQLQFLDPDPNIAQAAINSVLEVYQDIAKEEGVMANRRQIEFLEKQVVENHGLIASHEEDIRELSKEYKTDDLKPWYDAQLTEMIKLQSMWMQAALDRQMLELSLQPNLPNGEKASTMTPDQIAALDPTMRKLVMAQDEAQMEIQRLRGKGMMENHRQMIYARNELDLAKKQVEEYATKFREQVGAMQAAPDGQGGKVLLSIDDLKAKEAKLEQLFEDAKNLTMAIGEKHLQIKEHRDAIDKLKEQNLEFAERMEEYDVMAQMGGTMTIYPADRPVKGVYAIDKRKQFAAVGFVGGFGLPFAIFLMIGFLDSRYRYSEEAGTDMSGINLLGILPNLPDLLTDPEQAAIAAHCVHQIRTMLQINGGGEERRVFAVTSASPGDGKTSLTLALGLSFAASGSRTLIIDCDLVGAGLTTRMNMASDEGVLEAIANRTLLEYIRTTDISDLAILPVGSAQAHHASMLSPAALRRLVNEAKKHFETILIDTGPILGSIEASSVAAAVDGVILTVARGQQRPLVEKSLQHLKSIGARLAGVVFNRAQARDFERSVSRMSMRSVPTRNGNGNGHGNGDKNALAPANRFGPVARAVASSVKPATNGHDVNDENGHE